MKQILFSRNMLEFNQKNYIEPIPVPKLDFVPEPGFNPYRHASPKALN